MTATPIYPDPYVGEIRLFASRQCPKGWAICDGSLLHVAEYSLLFGVIGNTFGGDGKTNFALPDLRGRTPLGIGNGFELGERGGEEFVTLTESQLPAHTHTVNANAEGGNSNPVANYWGYSSSNPYASGPGALTLDPSCIVPYGNGEQHENRVPFLPINYIIALDGGQPAAKPFLSELRVFPFDHVPPGWIPCNGQILDRKSSESLFTLLGNTYGGDGKETFGVPSLNARIPLHRGTGFPPGAKGGEETHTLTLFEIPNHNHVALASTNTADSNTPQNNWWAPNAGLTPYGAAADGGSMSSQALRTVGSNEPHNNMSPYLALNICMAAEGIYPDPKSKDAVSDQWIGEIRIIAGTILPVNWFYADGQTMQMTSYMQLFSLIGTTYGGGGFTDFKLPNLQGLAAIMYGQGPNMEWYDLGKPGGAAVVKLTQNETPRHTHAAVATAEGTEGEPRNNIWANPASVRPYPNFYATDPGNNPYEMNPNAIAAVGGTGAHNNLMPYTVLNYCIATDGTFPPIN